MRKRYFDRLLRLLFALMAMLLMVACTSDVTTDNEEPLPEGMGRIRITICSPECIGGTRAVEEDPSQQGVHENPWETPDHEWERLQSFRIYICSASDDKVVQIIEGTKNDMSTPSTSSSESVYRSATVISQPLEAGNYHIYATANFRSSKASTNTYNANDGYDDTYNEESIIDGDAIKKFTNSIYYYIKGNVADDAKYSVKNIPMTGKLLTKSNGDPIKVENGKEEDAGTITVWRVMSKMQFEFTNESDKDIKILGIEVDPIYKVSSSAPGIYLFSKDDLESTDNLAPGTGVTLPDGARNDMGTVEFTPAQVGTPATLDVLTLAAKNDGDTDKGTLYFYINESDATFTTTNNQYSLRFKVQRKKDDGNWYEEEIRYGVTTHHDLSNNDPYGGYSGGFNVIRRNDWIHIPIVLTDWQLRIEPLAFVPIAGYPAKTVSSDGLTATFSTGGMIALQPFIKKYSDTTWRDFGDSEITYGKVVMDSEDNTKEDDEASWEASIRWKNADGDTRSGDDKIVKTPFAYDPVTKCIIGELNNNLDASNYTDNGTSVYTIDGHRYFKTTFTVCLRLGPDDDETKQYVYTFTFNVILKK